MQIAMIHDEIVPIEQLDPIYMDRGTYFGDGVYEVVRSYDGEIFALDEHLERFAKSLLAVDIAGVDIEAVRQKVERAYERATIANAKIYFHITRGSQPRNHLSDSDLRPNFFLTVTELADDSEEKAGGIAVSTYPDLRWKRCDIKSLNLLSNVLARRDAEKKGCTEAILVNEKGLITEGAGSAFFMVSAREKKLLTKESGYDILPSITREIVIRLAENTPLTVIQQAITPKQASQADELFIAVTTKGIVAVVEFDGKKISDGKPGMYTKQLIEGFRSEVQRRKRAKA